MSKRKRIRALRERIRAGGGEFYYDQPKYKGSTISRDDADILFTVSDQLDLHDYSDSRHEKILRHAVLLAENVGGLADALEDKDAAEDLVRWINRTYENPRTKCDFRLAIRAVGKHALRRGERGDPPESIDWMSGDTPPNYDPKPTRADMLDWEEDVRPLINHGTDNARNKALFAVQFEGGFRPHCELFEMRVGDVNDSEFGVDIEVDGKTGQRSVSLILALPYLNRWLGDHHPRPNDEDAYLWVKSNGERMSYTTFSRYFKRAADRIDLEKPATPKNFRKSNATWLARLGKNESFIEDRHGRERNSDAISHYIAMYGEDRAKEYAAMHGHDIETEDPQDYTPVQCPRCQKQTPQDKGVCMWCNQALDLGTSEELKEAEKTIKDLAMEYFQSDPEFAKDVASRRELSQVMMNNDELFETALEVAQEKEIEIADLQ